MEQNEVPSEDQLFENDEEIKDALLEDMEIQAIKKQEGPRRVKLNAEECTTNRIGKLIKDIPFTDYSGDTPEELIYEAEMTSLAIDDRKLLMKKATRPGRSGVQDLDWELFEDLMISKTFGFTLDQWYEFKKTHPIGLYTKMELLANEINGRSSLSAEDIEELKNLGGQEQ